MIHRPVSHSYQPAFLDTWTLLTWVAAQTSRIRVSGNVLNVPLRQPPMLARAAASLDLLSVGRFDLALGAGGFWDAIEAMGDRRLEPGQAVRLWRRPSTSSGVSGMPRTAPRCGWTANFITCTARTADQHRRMISRSGSEPS